jgi:uncharacterized protein
MKNIYLLLLLITSCLFSSCNVLVYYPEKTTYFHPRDYDMNFETVFLHASDGVAVHAWWLKTKVEEPIATVLHFHASDKNISYHLDYSRRLVDKGFNVLVFDYRGFGHSDGIPNKWGLAKDGIAAIDFVLDRSDVDPSKIIVFAQAEGVPVALSALEGHGLKPACIVFESPLYTYQKVTEDTIGDLPMGKLVSWPISLTAGLHDYNPARSLKSIYGTPILICHSENDQVIKSEHALSLYKDATQPKTLYLMPGGGHLALLKYPEGLEMVTSFMVEFTAHQSPQVGLKK